MFEAWGRFVYRRRRLVLLVAAVAVVGAALWGTGVFGALQSGGGFTAPGSESERAGTLATRAFGRDSADVVVLYRSPALTVRDPAYRAAVTQSLAALPTDKVLSYQTYWSTGSPLFAGRGGHETYAVLRLAGAGDAAKMKTYQAISGKLGAPGLTERVGGQIPTELAINEKVKADIGRAEGISMPALLILLLVIFGSLAAASMPLAIGAVGILGSFAALRLLTLVTDVSIYSINITTILGLGLAIDYGLFMVARFREELRGRPSVEDALARTVATAGRTVAVSGVTVAVALAGLMLFPEMFLRSMGYGGVATVVVDMLAALTVMPALLAVLGYRVNALRIRRSRGGRRMSPPAAGEASGAWYRIARSVMRRPVAYVAVIVVVLLALGAPFRSITWGGTDARALPANAAQRVDELASLGHTLPWMALVVVLATFLLLFLAFGSVVLPVKAIVMNALSLTATFGAIVWIFQQGHLSGLLRFTPTGTIDPTMPILMLAIIFGLSMDYEVFLLSRVRERYDVTADNTAAVAGGLQRTGGIITSLALLLVIVVGALSASGITFITLMGGGLIIALVVDATIIRVLLVPATMRLLGPATWWAPRPLRRLYSRYGIREDSGEAGPPEVIAHKVA